jgi:cytochrome P450
VSVDYDPFAAETLADPMAQYAHLRAQCPVHHFTDFNPPFFTLSLHDDVVEALKDVDTWSSRYGQSPQYTRPKNLNQDPPEHTEFRKLFQAGFAPRMVGRLEDEIVELANTLVDDMVGLGRGDLHDLYACPLPVIVIARLLGVPPADLAQFKAWSDELVGGFNSPDPYATDAVRAEMNVYFQAFVDERRKRLADAGVDEPGDEHVGTILPNDLAGGGQALPPAPSTVWPSVW